MTARIANPFALAPATIKAMTAVEKTIAESGLEPALAELVRTRASQINGCAYCVHMHTKDARARGESEERLYLVATWRESPLFTAKERAALGWTEALTRVAETKGPEADAEWALVRENFNESEQVHLTLLIGAINLWNRLAVGMRLVHPVDAARGAA
jgi:AhpD family alkylhydroperoxidase